MRGLLPLIEIFRIDRIGLAAQDWLVPVPAKAVVTSANQESEDEREVDERALVYGGGDNDYPDLTKTRIHRTRPPTCISHTKSAYIILDLIARMLRDQLHTDTRQRTTRPMSSTRSAAAVHFWGVAPLEKSGIGWAPGRYVLELEPS